MIFMLDMKLTTIIASLSEDLYIGERRQPNFSD